MSVKTQPARKTEARTFAGLSLRANFSWTFVGNAIYAATQWGLLILLTKLFEPAEFGSYALASSIVAPFFVASGLQLRTVQVTDVKHTARFTDYLVLRLVTSSLAWLTVIIVTLLGLVPAPLFSLILLLGLSQASLQILDIYQGARQKQERMDLVAISQVRIGIVALVTAAIFGLLWRNMVVLVAGLLLARALTILVFDVWGLGARSAGRPEQSRSAIRASLDAGVLLRLARTAFPLGIVMLLISLYTHIPRYFLASYGAATVGFFAAVASLVALQNMITGALGQSAVPRLSRYYTTDRRAYIRLLVFLAGIFLALGAAGVLIVIPFGEPILRLLFRPEYAQFADVFFWLLVGKTVLNVKSAIGYSMTAARIFGNQVWIEALSIATLCLFAWLLVPTWAGVGVAWAILIAACVGLIASLVVLLTALYREKEVEHD